MNDSQDQAEEVDDEQIGLGGVDEDIRSEYPPDEAMVLDMEPVSGEVSDSHDDLSRRDRVNRLADPADSDIDLLDDEPELVASEGDDASDLSAEEAAVHETSDPPMGEYGGGYV